MVEQEKILAIIRVRGPVLPAHVAKLIGTNILMASAHLSELVDSKKLFLSNTKIGGSPVYYVGGQEARLQELYKYLNEKDQRAFNLLKEKKVLMDSELEPLVRVALRTIKDFAVPLQVTHNGNKLLFWKWYLLKNDEAEGLIRLQLEALKKNEEIKRVEKTTEQRGEEKQKDLEEEKRRLEQEKRKSEEERLRLKKQKSLEKKKRELEQEKKVIEEKKLRQEKLELDKIQQDISDPFFDQLKSYFSQKRIEIVSYKIVRKRSEVDLILKVPSVVGSLDYYCKAKTKKRISDGDLSSAFVQGQLKKLPALMLITGELTKKAKELLSGEFKKGLVVKKI